MWAIISIAVILFGTFYLTKSTGLKDPISSDEVQPPDRTILKELEPVNVTVSQAEQDVSSADSESIQPLTVQVHPLPASSKINLLEEEGQPASQHEELSNVNPPDRDEHHKTVISKDDIQSEESTAIINEETATNFVSCPLDNNCLPEARNYPEEVSEYGSSVEGLISRGFTAKINGLFPEAANLFLQALKLYPSPDVSFNLMTDAYLLWSQEDQSEYAVNQLAEYWDYYFDLFTPKLRHLFLQWLYNQNITIHV